MDTKILWLDVETTGLSPYHNDIIQLAYMIEVNGVVKLERNLYMAPTNPDKIQEKALDVHGIRLDELLCFPPATEAHATFIADLSTFINKFNKTDKLYLGGFNVHFDIEFLVNWFKKCNDKYLGSWVNWRRVDVLDAASHLAVLGGLQADNLKLVTLAEMFEVPIKAHDALSDIKATRELYHKIMPLLGCLIRGAYDN